MAADPVTPEAGLVSVVTTGGTPVIVADVGPEGGFIVNPANAADQGLAEPARLFVDPVGAADVAARGTTFALEPGQSWPLIPGQTTPTTVNSEEDGHNFSVVVLRAP